MPKKKPKSDPVEADTVRIFLCDECGNVHLALVDEDGDVIAHASMPPDVADELRENIFKALCVTDARSLQ